MDLLPSKGMFPVVLQWLYRPLVYRAAHQILEGRYHDLSRPERGRWLRREVKSFRAAVWKRVDRMIPDAQLEDLPTYGNRHNVYLALVTTAAYQELIERGVERDYAATLTADVGWKIFAWMLRLAALPLRLTTRDPVRRMERTLRALMIFPFSAPGRPGYELEVRSEDDHIVTRWTHCPPQAFVRRLVTDHPDRSELEAFYRSWCLYDWAGADLLANDGKRGHYSRAHTMSRGDAVCDMCWYGRSSPDAEILPGRSACDQQAGE